MIIKLISQLKIVITFWLLFISNIYNAHSDEQLINAIANGNLHQVKKIISVSTDNVNVKDLTGNTPLIYAAQNGNEDIVKILIDAGADINAQNIYNNSALVWAATWGRPHIVRILISCGADAKYALEKLRELVDLENYDILKKKYKDAVELIRSTAIQYRAAINSVKKRLLKKFPKEIIEQEIFKKFN